MQAVWGTIRNMSLGKVGMSIRSAPLPLLAYSPCLIENEIHDLTVLLGVTANIC